MKPVKIVFASDFAPIRKFAPIMKENPAAIYGDLLSSLKEADYGIVNLESPLYTEDSYIVKSGAAFSGDPEHVESLKAGNFKAAICANNHTFDSGDQGFFKTVELLGQNGIACVGAGRNAAEARRPLEININGRSILLMAISEGEDMKGATDDTPGVRPWEVERLADEIRQARGKHDAIIVSAHCGLEYQPFPSYYVYEAFKKWAEAGADIIIGHHPHVPQGMAMFGKTPAYFSLGNFAFYQPVPLLYRKTGYMLELQITEKGITDHKMIPYRIGEQGLRRLNEMELTEFQWMFKKLSAPLETPEKAKEAWNAVLACNGMEGFQQELMKILVTMKENPCKGAAMLRNRVTCMQHSTQWTDGMTRIAEGTIDDAPAELMEIVKHYMTMEVEL